MGGLVETGLRSKNSSPAQFIHQDPRLGPFDSGKRATRPGAQWSPGFTLFDWNRVASIGGQLKVTLWLGGTGERAIGFEK